MKVLVADKISPKGVAYLRQQPGFEVIEAYGSSPEKILELVKDVHAIAVRSETKITAAVFAAAALLKVVGRAGVGVDNVDVDAATERGVVVMNTPARNTISTAELTFTHILCGARPVPQAAASMRAGQWDRKSFSGSELFRKTLGIVGLGRIGSEVAKRAQAFGMRVLIWARAESRARAHADGWETAASKEAFFEQCDVLTLHMRLVDATRGIVSEDDLKRMKPTALIVNFPSNPTAYLADLDFYKEIVAFARKHEIWVLSDLAYAEIYFDGVPPPSVLQVPGAREIAVEFTSMSKTYSMAGWRIGFAAGNKTLIQALTRIKSYLDYGAFTPIQVAATAALNGPQDCIAEARETYKERRDVLIEGLHGAGWDLPAPSASMFAWTLPAIYRKPWASVMPPLASWRRWWLAATWARNPAKAFSTGPPPTQPLSN